MTHDEIISAMRAMRDDAERGRVTADRAREKTAALIERLDPAMKRLARVIAVRSINGHLYGVIAAAERRAAGDLVRRQLLDLPASVRRDLNLTHGELPGTLDDAEAAVRAIRPTHEEDARRGYGVSALDLEDAMLIISNLRRRAAA